MDLDALTTAARASASRAADRSGVRIRPLDSTADSFAAEHFLCEVWQTEPDRPPIAADVIKAIADAGSYVAGVIDEAGEPGRLLGACVGFWGPPGSPEMHSHIAGVHAAARSRSVGLALKLDQRAHVLEHGVGEITWTFDPLVARNAHFNLRKLGGGVDRYLVDHYGKLADGINGEDPSDRLLLRWDLLGERARAACDTGTDAEVGMTVSTAAGAAVGTLPATASGTGRGTAPPPPRALLAADDDRPVRRTVTDERVLVAVPPDIETLRTQQPDAARAWRNAVRDTLGALLADGGHVVDFDRAACGYVVERSAG